MLIESKIRREGGSKIDIGGVVYHFAPGADGAHVCDVTDEDALARFLAIPEGFRLVTGVAFVPKPDAQPPAAAEVAPAPTAAPAAPAAPSGMVLIGDDEVRVDLMALSKKELLVFAKGKFKVDAMGSAQSIREAIYKQAQG